MHARKLTKFERTTSSRGRIAAIAIASVAIGQNSAFAVTPITLSGASYLENFNSLGSGLPVGFQVAVSATSSSLGTTTGATYTSAATAWSTGTSGFANYASVGSISASSTSAQQNSDADRAIGLRQTSGLGDPGAAFEFEVANTTGFANFNLSIDLQEMSAQSRSTTFTIDYGLGTSPSSFISLGSFSDPGAFGTSTFTKSLGTVLDNLSGPVWFRVAALSGSSGTGTRDTVGIDNFKLTYSAFTAASTYFWTSDSSTLGGSGTWSSANNTWSASDTTVAGSAIDPLDHLGVFKGQAGNVAVSGSVEADAGLQFSSDGYVLSQDAANPGTITLGGSTASANVITVDNALSAVIDVPIAASAGLTKAGAGTLTMSGAVTGSPFVSGGKLIVAGTVSGNATVSTGTLQIGKAGTSGSIGGDIANTGAVIVNRSDVFTYAGAITGSGTFEQAGTGTLILTGANAINGGVTISAGTLQLGTGSAGSLSGSIADNANLVFGRSDTGLIITGGISGSGTVTQLGGGKTTLTGSYASTTLTTAVSAGTLAFGQAANSTIAIAAATSGGGFAGDVDLVNPVRVNLQGTLSGGGRLFIDGTNSALTGVTVSSNAAVIGNSIVLNNAGSSNFLTNIGATGGNTLTVNGQISGTSDVNFAAGGAGSQLALAGAGTIVLGAQNVYIGRSIINTASSGIVRLAVDNALPTTTALSFAGATGTLDLNGHSQSIVSLSSTDGSAKGIGNATSSPAGTLSITGSAVTNYGSPLGQATGANIALKLASTHSGRLTLSGANLYTGGTTIDGGTLLASGGSPSASATGTGAVTVNGGGTLGGTGRVGGMAWIAGTITAGTGASSSDTPGKLTIGDLTTFRAGGTDVVKFAASSSTTGGTSGSFDQLVMSTLDLSDLANGPFNLKLIKASGGTYAFGQHTFKIADITSTGGLSLPSGYATPVAGGPTDVSSLFTLNYAGLGTTADTFAVRMSFDTSDGNGYVMEVVETPEPTTALLFGGSAIAMLAKRRRTAEAAGASAWQAIRSIIG